MTYDHRSTDLHLADLDREIDTLRNERILAAGDRRPGLVERTRRGTGRALIAAGTALIGREGREPPDPDPPGLTGPRRLAEPDPAAYHPAMSTTTTDRLPFTGDDAADRLLVSDPLALLIGFALDQQVPLQKAFSGPLKLSRRIGGLDARRIADDEPRRPRCRVPDPARPPPLPRQHGQARPRARRLPRRPL